MPKQAEYIEEGAVINDYLAGANVVVGEVVVLGAALDNPVTAAGIAAAGRVGVATVAIANGATGAIAIEGVFQIPYKAADTPVRGAPVYWDNATNEGTSVAAAMYPMGYIHTVISDTVVLVKLHG